jgi:uncharacterized protein YkwD
MNPRQGRRNHAPKSVPGAPRRARLPRLAAATTLAAALLVGMAAVASPAEAHARTNRERLYANAVLSTLNAERRAHHLAPLRADSRLKTSARRHDMTMASRNVLSHQLPGEAVFTRRISATGYHWSWAGENIAYNSQITQSGVVLLQKLMYNEKAPNNGHRLNILNPHFRNVGVDVYIDSAHHKVWLTTDFGRQ